jgi:hypothetical protein
MCDVYMKGYMVSIEKETNKNSDFRRVLYTGRYNRQNIKTRSYATPKQMLRLRQRNTTVNPPSSKL